MTVVGIGAFARLNEAESEFSGRRDEDYLVVDFSLFADLVDGRRIESVSVYQEGGSRTAWAPVAGEPVDAYLSRSLVESVATRMVGPGGRLQRACAVYLSL